MKKLNWKIILIVVIVIIVVSISVWYYNKKKNTITIDLSNANRFEEVKCVVECKDDEVCIKGACVKKKINYTL